MKQLEIERRFLLKNIPKMVETSVYAIEQFYTPSGERFRKSFKAGQGNKWRFEKIIKRHVEGFINEEEIFECSQQDYLDNYQTREKLILKKRYVFEENGLKFEVDEFLPWRLIICEVELKDKDQQITFPDPIQKEVILEITGMKEFNNFNLAEKK